MERERFGSSQPADHRLGRLDHRAAPHESFGGRQLWSQDSPKVLDVAELDDYFGEDVA